MIGRRLSHLSEDCNRLLAVASVIGREFGLDTLNRITGETAGRVEELLGEAVKVAVLQEQAKRGAVQYRFAHAFFRQTLYEELSAPRRIRMHQQVARALEAQYEARPEEHAADLAEHFAHSSDAADLEKAVRYGELAAQRSLVVYAYGEAVRLLEQALEVQEVLDPGDRAAVCDLLSTLATALIRGDNPLRAAEEIAPRAFALAVDLADDERAASIAWIALSAMGAYAAGDAQRRPEYRAWAEGLARHAKEGTALGVSAELALFQVATGRRRNLQAWEHGQRAQAQARTLGSAELIAETAGNLVNWPGDVRHCRERLRRLDEFIDRPEISDIPTSGGNCFLLNGGSYLCFAWGQRGRWELLLRRARAGNERQRSPRLMAGDTLQAATPAFVDGELEGAVVKGYEFRQLAEAAGSAGWGQLFGEQVLWYPLLNLGRYDEVLELGRSLGYSRPVCLAHMGRLDEARQELRANGVLRRVLAGDEESNSVVLAPLLETAVLAGDEEVAGLLLERLNPLADLASCYNPESCPGRHLGAAAALLGRREEAFQYYQRALAVAERVRFRPEVALVRLQMAELLADGDANDQEQAAEHLAFVVPELQSMKMAPALERARALQQRLGHPAGETIAPDAGLAVPPPESVAVGAITTDAEQEQAPEGTVAGASIGRHVFISYASVERSRAEQLAEKLEQAGFAIWLDREAISGGTSWDAEIVRGIKGSGTVVVLVSPTAVRSKNVQQKLRLAMQYDRPLLPLLLEQTEYPEDVEYALAGRQHIELFDRPAEEWLPRVLAALRRLS